MNIAVTGGFGTGKSTVSKILAVQLQAELIDTDELCRLQMLPGTKGFAKFQHQFAGQHILSDGTLDRNSLRDAVFADGKVKSKLEGILHPIVRAEVARRCKVSAERGKLLVIEVPLLYEVAWQEDFDHTVVVYVPEEMCIARVVARDKLALTTIIKVLDSQISIEDKRGFSDYVIDNSGTFVSTVQQIAWLCKKLFDPTHFVFAV